MNTNTNESQNIDKNINNNQTSHNEYIKSTLRPKVDLSNLFWKTLAFGITVWYYIGKDKVRNVVEPRRHKESSLRRWVVDMDDVEEGSDKVIQMCDIIRSCDCGVKDPITFLNKTRSGVHIITHPFNLKQFTGNLSALGIEAPEIKKNHITLLYENL